MNRPTWGALLGGTAMLAAMALAAQPSAAQTREELMEAHRGGTLRLVATSAAGTIDPHINYTSQFWRLYQYAYDGLVTFQKAPGEAGGVVVPDLAVAIPEPSADGLSYTFELRPGLMFSDGSELGVDDVVASLQRIYKVSGPTSGTFYNGIVGAEACIASPADCTLEGGVVADAAAGTVTITLTAPDPEFLQKLAVPHAVILPAETPATDAGVTPVPTTGPYMFESYNPNEGLVMVRNPHFREWSAEAQPDGFADRIEYAFGQTAEAQVTAVQNAQADYMFDQPPADRLAEIGTQYAEQVHVNPLGAFWYAPMNTNLAPFDDPRVRQAVNFAVDRAALVGLFGGPVLAQPVCTILPPGFPGHVDDCQYTADPGPAWTAPDMERALALIEESGTAGQPVTVVVEDTTTSRAIGTYLQSMLTDLGYEASVNAISANIHFTYIQNTSNEVQISVSQWYQDYPAASNFLNVLLSCASFRPGTDASVNIAGYCNPEIDARMAAASALSATDPEAALAEWALIDQAIMADAPVAPLFTPQQVDFTSNRAGNYLYSNLYGWIISQAWVQ